MTLESLLTTLILGSYLFTVGAFLRLDRKLDRLLHNHILHLEKELAVVRKDLADLKQALRLSDTPGSDS